MCRQEEIALVGGGNSAGQAAVFLSGFAAKISMLLRADSLASSTSRYLIERIQARPNIELLCRTEIVALTGTPEGLLERVRWRHAPTGAETERAIRNVFLFIGADPATNWLRTCGVGLDANGFVQTGPRTVAANAAVNGSIREPLLLESNLPGVFAVGNARSGSVKRVGGTIGEGAAVVAQLHSYLAAGPFRTARAKLRVKIPKLNDEHRRRLGSAGGSAEKSGQLELRDWDDLYFRDGRFDQHANLTLWQTVFDDAHRQGTRVIGHLEWAPEDREGVNDLLEYEARLNLVSWISCAPTRW